MVSFLTAAVLCPAGMFAVPLSADPLPEEPLARRVVAVMWDGVDPSYLDGRARTPVIDRMIAEGVFYPKVRTAYPSVTNTCFSSIVTGAWPRTSGIRAVWWDRERNEAFGQDRIFDAETIVQSIRRGGRSSASIGMWLFIDRGLSENTPGALYLNPETGGPYHDFGPRVDVALEFLRGEHGYVPDFLSVYANTIDSIGHAHGPASPLIVEALETMDAHLGRLLAGLKELGMAEETAVMLISDHGMSPARTSIRSQVTRALSDRGYRMEWLGTSRSGRGGAASARTELVAVTFGRHASVYFKGRNQSGGQRPFTEAEKEEVTTILRGLPHMAGVLTRSELDKLNAHPDVGDLSMEAEPPHGFFTATYPETRGAHGSTMEQHFPLILWGAGVREGLTAEGAQSVDISPTIARLLAAPAPEKAEGRVLREALRLPEGER